MFYKNNSIFHEVLEELFKRLASNDEVKKSTGKIETTLRFIIEDLQTSFTLIIDKGNILLDSNNENQPKSVIKMNSDIFHEAMTGTLNFFSAFINKSFVVEGDTKSILSLARLSTPLSIAYNDVLNEKILNCDI